MDGQNTPAHPAPRHDVPVEVRYRMLVEQIPAVTYICEFSPDAPFLYLSPQVEQMLGYPASRESYTSGRPRPRPGRRAAQLRPGHGV